MKVLDEFGHILHQGDLCRDELGDYWRLEGVVRPPDTAWSALVRVSRRDKEAVRAASAFRLRVLGDAHV